MRRDAFFFVRNLRTQNENKYSKRKRDEQGEQEENHLFMDLVCLLLSVLGAAVTAKYDYDDDGAPFSFDVDRSFALLTFKIFEFLRKNV